MSAADEVIAVIEDMLTTLAVADRGDWNVPDMGFYDGAIINHRDTYDYMVSRFEEFHGRGDSARNRFLNTHSPVRGALIFWEGGKIRYNLVGARELNYQERQKVAPLLSAYLPVILSAFDSRIVETRAISIDNNGRATTTERNHFVEWKGKWGSAKHENQEQSSSFGFAMATTVTAVNQLSWSVRIRLAPLFPSIGLFTDPPGVREFFKLRDVPEGASRRRALLHWVSQHWRQTRNDPDSEAHVREHLRGDRSFSWGGMTGEILIPEIDERRIEAGIHRRKELKIQGLDRRLRQLKL